MRDALVSFATLLLVCSALWASAAALSFLVDASTALLSASQSWFCVGFATALLKPWRHVLPCTKRCWELIDEVVPR